MIIGWLIPHLLLYERIAATIMHKFQSQAITLNNHTFIITRAEDSIPPATLHIQRGQVQDGQKVEMLESYFTSDPSTVLKRIAWLEYLAGIYIEADDFDRANRALEHLWWWAPQVHCLLDLKVWYI